MTVPAMIGIMLLLNGEGKMLPTGLSNTACGVNTNRETMAIIAINAMIVTRKARRCLNISLSPMNRLLRASDSPLCRKQLYAIDKSSNQASTGVAIMST